MKIFLYVCLLEADGHRPMVKTPKSTDHAHILKANNMIQYTPLSGSAKLYCLWSIKVIQYLTEGWTWCFGCDGGAFFGQSSLFTPSGSFWKILVLFSSCNLYIPRHTMSIFWLLVCFSRPTVLRTHPQTLFIQPYAYLFRL